MSMAGVFLIIIIGAMTALGGLCLGYRLGLLVGPKLESQRRRRVWRNSLGWPS